MPDTNDMNGKILYFEMHTHPPDKSALFFTKGWAKMRTLSGDHVSVSWPEHLGSVNYKAVTFKPEFVHQFRPNVSGEKFDILFGDPVTPDFIYIEKPIGLSRG